MNRIERKFRELKRAKKKAFIAYITAGDPTVSVTKKLVKALERSGTDIIELGIPFSDPLADGPTIQRASERALRGRTSLRAIFAMTEKLKEIVGIPLVMLSYYNPILKFGLKRFIREAKAAGIEGVIVPDLPPEEGQELKVLARRSDFALIFLAAPTSTSARIRKITADCSGFVYYVSLTGVTGARASLPPGVAAKLIAPAAVQHRPA